MKCKQTASHAAPHTFIKIKGYMTLDVTLDREQYNFKLIRLELNERYCMRIRKKGVRLLKQRREF